MVLAERFPTFLEVSNLNCDVKFYILLLNLNLFGKGRV